MHGVLTLAGEGTRMLPWTRGLRKEFLPLYDLGGNGTPILKPVAHLALESLSSAGADEITLVVGGRDLVTAQNYFTVDRTFLKRHAHHRDRLTETERFYGHLRELRLRFAVQSEPRGFGDAVLQARGFVGHEPFLLHAADAALLEPHRGRALAQMAALQEREDLDGVLLVRRVADPTRYGVVEGPYGPNEGAFRSLVVTGMEEKPAKPRSHWAATAVYTFSARIFDALDAVARETRPAELELTAAIAHRLSQGGRFVALILTPRTGEWRSVGSAEGYLTALQRTRVLAQRRASRS
ncbi:MAG TPA: sugar phosphate nucleotidyltransferase [Thermoplasmata archaeon]|nr:sugar phosphate nucleotidyltransferase [Thermoplasmata archaeon]